MLIVAFGIFAFVVQPADADGGDIPPTFLFAMNLAPDGDSSWTAGHVFVRSAG